MSSFTVEKAYGEITRMCALILNVLAGDVDDGFIKVDRYHERRLMTKDEATDIIDATGNFNVGKTITEASHKQDIEFFTELIKKICACPPEVISFSYIYDNTLIYTNDDS